VCVALVIHHAKRMRPVVMSAEFCPSLQYFSTLPYKQHDFHKKKGLIVINCVKIHLPTNASFIKHIKY